MMLSVSTSYGNQATSSQGGASVHVIHPGQFGGFTQPEPPLHQRLRGLATQARGRNPSDIMHETRDLMFSGHPIAQHMLRGASVIRGALNA